jgi:hypothetical protein
LSDCEKTRLIFTAALRGQTEARRRSIYFRQCGRICLSIALQKTGSSRHEDAGLHPFLQETRCVPAPCPRLFAAVRLRTALARAAAPIRAVIVAVTAGQSAVFMVAGRGDRA